MYHRFLQCLFLPILAAALTLGALLAPRPAAAMIPRDTFKTPANPAPYFAQNAGLAPLTDSAEAPEYVLLIVEVDGLLYGFICRNDPVNWRDPEGKAAWADIVWGAMSTAEEFYGSRANNWFTQGLLAGLMTVATPLAGVLTAADLVTDQIGTFAGELSASDFQPTHIPVVGPVAGNIGTATAAAVEDPSVVNISKAVGASLGAVELALGSVMIKRGIQGTAHESEATGDAAADASRQARRAVATEGTVDAAKSPSFVTAGQYDGVRQLSQTLRAAGLPRDARLEVINSFREGSIVARTAASGENVVRFHSGGVTPLVGQASQPRGRFVTPSFPVSGDALSGLALPNFPGGISQFNLRQGATFFEGTVAPNFGKPGGGVQYFVPNLSDLVAP